MQSYFSILHEHWSLQISKTSMRSFKTKVKKLVYDLNILDIANVLTLHYHFNLKRSFALFSLRKKACLNLCLWQHKRILSLLSSIICKRLSGCDFLKKKKYHYKSYHLANQTLNWLRMLKNLLKSLFSVLEKLFFRSIICWSGWICR